MNTRLNVIFRGRVQGVGFRATTCDVARRFAVSGFVRNEPDRSVLCVAEGIGDEVDAFVAAVHDAMRCNIVDVERRSGTATGEFDGFTIRR
ncbi:MAG: acylphosphatase [Phycisphaerales bacterium]